MDNLQIYNAVRAVPEKAKKGIGGGRLKGKTDINPMWRIEKLTEQFGPCGTGWKYVIINKWLEKGIENEIAAFVDIELYYKNGDAWSEAIPGTGGNRFVSVDSSGTYVDDDCYKKALTDAISVAAKALGIGADVYWGIEKSKYDNPREPAKIEEPPHSETLTAEDTTKLREATNTAAKKAAGVAILAEWGLKSSKEIPHSRVAEFIGKVEGA